MPPRKWKSTKTFYRPGRRGYRSRYGKTIGKKYNLKLVKKNTKDIKQLQSAGFQYVPFQNTISETTDAAIHTHLLTQPSNWEQIFRGYEVPDDALPRQYTMKSISINWFAQCENSEVGNLWLQVMVVSLKSKKAAQVIERTTRLSNMTENLDYVSQAAGTGLALQGNMGYKLNPNLYTVHYNSGQRRIGQATMGADQQVTNINNSTTRGACNIKFPRVFKNDEHSDAGFKDLGFAEIEPNQHLYLIYFSNTSGDIVTGGELFTSHRAEIHGNCNLPE